MSSKIQFHHIIILQYSCISRIWGPVSCNPVQNSLGISNQMQQYARKSSSNNNYQFNEHPVGNAMPASNPFSDINLRTVFSNVSHSSVIGIPGFMMPFIYFLTCRYVNLDEQVGILCTVLAITLMYTDQHHCKPFTFIFSKAFKTYTHIFTSHNNSV